MHCQLLNRERFTRGVPGVNSRNTHLTACQRDALPAPPASRRTRTIDETPRDIAGARRADTFLAPRLFGPGPVSSSFLGSSLRRCVRERARNGSVEHWRVHVLCLGATGYTRCLWIYVLQTRLAPCGGSVPLHCTTGR